jgi:hypothetical protein
VYWGAHICAGTFLRESRNCVKDFRKTSRHFPADCAEDSAHYIANLVSGLCDLLSITYDRAVIKFVSVDDRFDGLPYAGEIDVLDERPHQHFGGIISAPASRADGLGVRPDLRRWLVLHLAECGNKRSACRRADFLT